MGRVASNHFELQDGRSVGYGFKVRGGVYYVQVKHPTEPKYVSLSTNCTTKADALTEAAKIVLKLYKPTLPPDPKRTDWDTALAELAKTPALRPDTLRNYRTVVSVLRSTLPESKGPPDITPALAQRFKRLYLSGTTKRSKAADAKGYKRSPTSCRTYLRTLRSLWNQHFKELGYVSANPWMEVAYPAVESKPVRLPAEEAVGAFYTWLAARYPGWPLLHLWAQVKAVSGCRTLELCEATSEKLRDGTLTILTKSRTWRTFPLPADLFQALDRIKGPTYLWESYTADAKTYRPGTRNRDTFDPKTVYWAVSNIFREFNEAHPKAKVKAHDLRKRAITLTTAATGSVDETAKAIGIDPQTARRYYLDAQRAFDSDALLKKMAGVLNPAKT